ncbi:hypothetical protein GCM10010398_73350 [Streptomyces fimbriatus]
MEATALVLSSQRPTTATSLEADVPRAAARGQGGSVGVRGRGTGGRAGSYGDRAVRGRCAALMNVLASRPRTLRAVSVLSRAELERQGRLKRVAEGRVQPA